MTQRVDPASDRAVYRQVADDVRAGIAAGKYQPGRAVPSEARLVEEYDVSRVTARRALAELERQGLVRPEHGRGWIVRSRPPVRRLVRTDSRGGTRARQRSLWTWRPRTGRFR